MKTINTLFDKVNEEKITYHYANLNGKANGMCVNEGNDYYIIMDPVIKKDDILHKLVLAEEIGHYYTMVDDPTPRLNDCHERHCRIEKEENKAIKWAADFLVPTEDLLDYFSSNLSASFFDLVEYFEVTEDFMNKKLYHMSLKQPYYEVCENRYLCLQNLPSIYITGFFDADLASKAKALYGRKL